jgi:tagatose 6-phosphate kinase
MQVKRASADAQEISGSGVPPALGKLTLFGSNASAMVICVGTTPAVQRTMIFGRLMPNAVNRASRVLETAAGKSVNVARLLGILGKPALATGFAGGDRGRFILAELDRHHVLHDFVAVAPDTRMCITVIDQETGEHTELVEESVAVGDEAWEQLRARLRGLIPKARMITMSGTLVPGAPAGFYADCVRWAHDAGIAAIVDATGEPMRLALAQGPDLIKPNRAELAGTLGMCIDSEPELIDAMKRVCELGARRVVVTMGGQGAMGQDGADVYRIQIPRVEVVNTIGSGDSVTAGIVCALLDGADFAEACRLGAACGVANALTLTSGEIHLEDVRRLREQVRVQRL